MQKSAYLCSYVRIINRCCVKLWWIGSSIKWYLMNKAAVLKYSQGNHDKELHFHPILYNKCDKTCVTR